MIYKAINKSALIGRERALVFFLMMHSHTLVVSDANHPLLLISFSGSIVNKSTMIARTRDAVSHPIKRSHKRRETV
jgi:hypothetical protein